MITWCIRFVWMSHKPKKKRGYCISSRGAERIFSRGRGGFLRSNVHTRWKRPPLWDASLQASRRFLFALRIWRDEPRRDSPLFGCVFAFLRIYGRLSRVTPYVVFLSTAVIKGDMILKREQRTRAALWWHAVFVAPKGNERFPHHHVLYEKPLWAIKPADMIWTDTKACWDGALLPNGEWIKSTHIIVLSSWCDGFTCWTVFVLEIFVPLL